MHEFFLCAIVPSERVDAALRILQGYCGHQPRHRFRRALAFQKHPAVPKQGFADQHIQQRAQIKQQLYKELATILKKQPYSLHLLYELEPEDFKVPPGVDAASVPEAQPKPVNLNVKPGTLIWRDIPDPPSGRSVNSRRVVVIRDEELLPQFLAANANQFRSEQIQEYWRAVRDDVDFYFFRILQFPDKQPTDKTGQAITRESLPAFQDLIPFDAEDKWVLCASVNVADPTDPRQTKQAIEELLTVKAQLGPELDFQLVDRRPLDTRLAQLS